LLRKNSKVSDLATRLKLDSADLPMITF